MSNQENPLAFVELLTKMNTRPWRQLRGNFKVSPYRFVRVSIRMLSPLRGVDSGGINICRSLDRLKGKLNHFNKGSFKPQFRVFSLSTTRRQGSPRPPPRVHRNRIWFPLKG